MNKVELFVETERIRSPSQVAEMSVSGGVLAPSMCSSGLE